MTLCVEKNIYRYFLFNLTIIDAVEMLHSSLRAEMVSRKSRREFN